jgi:2'-5' RNA ligase
MEGKYFIAHLLSGEAKKYSISLSRKISKKFDIECINKRTPPHITIKYFSRLLNKKQIGKIAEFLKDYCNKTSKSEYEINGFGSFNKKVNFINIKPSKKMENDYNLFMKNFRKFKFIEQHEYEKRKNKHFHVTIATEYPQEKFGKINKYLKNIKKPYFKMHFDSLVILKKPANKWIVYKKFKFSKT